MFGAKPAQSETPVRAARPSGVHPEEAQWDRRREATEKYGLVKVPERSVAKWQEQKGEIRGDQPKIRYVF